MTTERLMRVLTLPLALLVVAVGLAAPVPKAKVEPTYFPMTVGDTREYEWRTGGKTDAAYTDEVSRAEKQKDGSTHVTVRRTHFQGSVYTTVIAVSATSLARVSDDDKPLTEPAVLLKLPATVGTKWEEGQTKYEVTAEEEVTVLAGKYTAAKVEMTAGGRKRTLWFAPAVGLVKMDPGGNQVLELKAFKPGEKK